MVRLRKHMKKDTEGKKSFNLHTPISLWTYFENYCKSLNLKPTQAINLLIEEELIEAGIIQNRGGTIVAVEEEKNVDQNIEEKTGKKEPKKRATKRRTKKQKEAEEQEPEKEESQ